MMKYTPAPPPSEQSLAIRNSADPLDGFMKIIKAMTPQISAALPRQLSADRIVRIIMTEVRRNPKLADCDRASFFGAILQCAQLGLEPGSAMGHAYLVPRKIKGRLECQLQIGYQGMIELAERDGRVTVEANLVFENDEFEMELGTKSYIKHRPCFGKKEKGVLIGAYAVAIYKDGRVKFRFVDINDIEQAKKISSSGEYGPWKDNYNEMARKTSVRRLFKYLPKSTEIAKVMELEDKLEMPNQSQELAALAPGDEKTETIKVETYDTRRSSYDDEGNLKQSEITQQDFDDDAKARYADFKAGE